MMRQDVILSLPGRSERKMPQAREAHRAPARPEPPTEYPRTSFVNGKSTGKL
jgi:hypothetical protein